MSYRMINKYDFKNGVHTEFDEKHFAIEKVDHSPVTLADFGSQALI
ncbi:unnamed protein product, partial [Rotaria socialis]